MSGAEERGLQPVFASLGATAEKGMLPLCMLMLSAPLVSLRQTRTMFVTLQPSPDVVVVHNVSLSQGSGEAAADSL